MKAILVRHTFPDRPDWTVIKEDIPLGKEYDVLGFRGDGIIINHDTGESRDVECYLCRDTEGHIGYIVVDVLSTD